MARLLERESPYIPAREDINYPVPSHTMYFVDECPFPDVECRSPVIANLTAVQMVVGKHTIEITCSPIYEGYLAVLRSGSVRVGIKIPDETHQAAQSLAQCFAGAIVFDPDGNAGRV